MALNCINPYQLYYRLDILEQNSHSTTYKALNLVNDQLVTAKIFKRVSKQINMAQIIMLKQLDHPTILKLLETHETSDEIWLVFEYCQNGNLSDLVRKVDHHFSDSEIAWISYNLLEAINYLQEEECYHGNIRLENILVDALGNIKLTNIYLDQNYGFQEKNFSSFENGFIMRENCINEDIRRIGSCIKEMLQEKYFSLELEDFMKTCLKSSIINIFEVSQLFAHKFIRKYKQNFNSIKTQFSEKCFEEIKTYRQKN